VARFLAQTAPFSMLTPPQRDRAIAAMEIAFARVGERLVQAGRRNAHLFLIRRGAVEITSGDGDLVARAGEGRCFGHVSLLSREVARFDVRCIEDTLYYRLPAGVFQSLCSDVEPFRSYFRDDAQRRLSRAVAGRRETETGSTPAGRLLRGPAAVIDATAPVGEAARVMTLAGASAIAVLRADRLVGILTDRDLRTRVLARHQGPERPVADVMTPDPWTVTGEASLAEVLALMLARGVHHVPVLGDGTLLGMLDREDLLRAEQDHPVHLLADIDAAPDEDALIAQALRLPALIVRMAEADALAEHIGRVVSAATDGLTRRLLHFAEQALGPAPAPWAWIALGSQGREEQFAGSDQDNALILHPETRDADLPWFAALAERVCAGLDACGIPRCRGDVMATNPAWRMTVDAWQRTFRKWTTEPEARALMHACIFFDLRHGAGDPALTHAVRESMHEQARNSRLFLTLLAHNAARQTPPLGFFRRFVLEHGGDHADRLDLKHRGAAPLTDVARVHALVSGIRGSHTADRLRACSGERLAESSVRSLVDALEFINHVRVTHQAALLRSGEAPDNFVAPDALSPLEQRHLRAAFEVVRDAQRVLVNEFHLA
jgi:CBS domain-containing protein